MRSSAHNHIDSTSSQGMDCTDGSIPTHTTTVRGERPGVPAPLCEDKTYSLAEEELFSSRPSSFKISRDYSNITVRMGDKCCTLLSKELNGPTILAMSLIPTEMEETQKEPWRSATFRGKLKIPADHIILDTLAVLKTQILNLLKVQSDTEKKHFYVK